MSRTVRELRRVGAYIRVSTEMQVDGYSLASQESEVREYCDRDRGLTLAELYVEKGESAYNEKSAERPQFSRIMKDALEGRIEVILTPTLDRFSRRMTDISRSIDLLEKHGVGFISLQPFVDTTSGMGTFTAKFFGVFAEHTSRQISINVRNSIAQRVKQGKSISPKPPYGYVLCDSSCQTSDDHGRLHIDPKRAPIVVDIFERYATGQYSMREIADWLNGKGHRTNGYRVARMGSDPEEEKEGLFGSGSVGEILESQAYIGKIKYKGEFYDGDHDPIIDAGLFDKVERERTRRSTRSRGGRNAKHTHELGKLLHCAECGSPLWSERRNEKTYYRFPERGMVSRCVLAGKRIPGSNLEFLIDAIFSEFHLRPDWKEYLLNEYMKNTDAEEILKRRGALECQMERLKDMYELGDRARDYYIKKEEEIGLELLTLQLPEMDEMELAGEFLEDFRNVWNAASSGERNRLLRSVLHKIYVDPECLMVVALEAKEEFGPAILAMQERAIVKLRKGGNSDLQGKLAALACQSLAP